MQIEVLLKDSDIRLEIFTPEQIHNLEERISTKESRGKTVYVATCLIRGTEIRLFFDTWLSDLPYVAL